ncbi:hypothetical protein [Vibrio atlanticus]|uniref:hypothetical protein n=1 Tax=Vibrio atlanticus TaxID=693153 RepID=UPI003D0C446B
MKRFTDSIRKAIDSQDWYGALSTALTLPDVCARLEDPTLGSKARYIQWYDTWMLDKYTREIGRDRVPHVFLHGDDCYALRCSYLHEGGSNIEEQRAQKALEDFQFIYPRKGQHVHCNQMDKVLQLQVDVFCLEIADTVDEWALSVEDNADIQMRISKLLVIQ